MSSTEMHRLLTDAEFERQFAHCVFTPQHFTHEAHLRLARIHVNKYGVATAAHNLCQQISRFDRTYGDGTKFNHTVTVASVHIIAHFLAKATTTDFEGLLTEFPRLKNSFRDLLRTHYGFDPFTNARARREYMAPDLLAF